MYVLQTVQKLRGTVGHKLAYFMLFELDGKQALIVGTAHVQCCTAWIPPGWVGMELERKGVFKRWDG